MNSLLFLGTGPGQPVAGRGCSSALLRVPGATVLIDAGEPCSLRLKEWGVALESLDAVLLTHAHSDHVGGLPMLMQVAWLEPRRRALPLYLPGPLETPLRQWLEAVHLPDALLGFSLEYHAWQVGHSETLANGGVVVTPFRTTHLDRLSAQLAPDVPHRLQAFGMEVLTADRRLVFSSDLGAPEDLRDVLSTPCDVLVCELSHFEPDALWAFLQGRVIGQLVLNHLAADLAGREEELAAAARRALPQVTKVVVPRDGDEVRF